MFPKKVLWLLAVVHTTLGTIALLYSMAWGIGPVFEFPVDEYLPRSNLPAALIAAVTGLGLGYVFAWLARRGDLA